MYKTPPHTLRALQATHLISNTKSSKNLLVNKDINEMLPKVLSWIYLECKLLFVTFIEHMYMASITNWNIIKYRRRNERKMKAHAAAQLKILCRYGQTRRINTPLFLITVGDKQTSFYQDQQFLHSSHTNCSNVFEIPLNKMFVTSLVGLPFCFTIFYVYGAFQ